MPILRTSGINYPPPPPQEVQPGSKWRRVAVKTEPDADMSTLHLEFDVKAMMGDQAIQLYAAAGTCGSGCRRRSPLLKATGIPEGFDVEIIRFAKEGRTSFSPSGLRGLVFGALHLFRRIVRSTASGPGFKWLVTMQDC